VRSSRRSTVVAGIVDDRRKEVDREDERPVLVEQVDGGVVRRREADEQTLRLHRHESAQELLEAGGRILRRAPTAAGQIGQANVHVSHRISWINRLQRYVRHGV
jgi:hypothetical protein